MKLMTNMTAKTNDRNCNYTIGDEHGEPYVVRIQEGVYIPVSILIFAQREEDAKDRVIRGLEMRRDNELEYKKEIERRVNNTWHGHDRVIRTLGMVSRDCIEVEKMDKRYITKAVWASNYSLG